MAMYAFFNTVNQLTFVSENIIQGSKGANTLYASFEGKNWANFPIASITFRRDDGSTSPEIYMVQEAFTYNNVTYSNGYKFVFYDEWFAAIAGKLEATIRLYGIAGQISAMGLITTEVQEAVNPGNVVLTGDQYETLVSFIAEASRSQLIYYQDNEPTDETEGDIWFDIV